MKFKKAKVVAALVDLGYKKAGDWDDEKLVGKLRSVPAKVDEDEALQKKLGEDADLSDFVTSVRNCIEQDEAVELVAGGKAPKAKAEKGDGEKKTRKPPEIKKDQFGCRLGSKSAHINSALSKKPQTVAAIAEKAGCTEQRAKGHLMYWVKREAPFVHTEDDKWYIKS